MSWPDNRVSRIELAATIAFASFWCAPVGARAAPPEGIEVLTENREVGLGGKPFWIVKKGEPFEIAVRGPKWIGLQVRAFYYEPRRESFEATLVVERDGFYRSTWVFKGTGNKAKRNQVTPGNLGFASGARNRHIEVPGDDVTYTVRVDCDTVDEFIVTIEIPKRFSSDLALEPGVPLDPEPPPAPEEEGEEEAFDDVVTNVAQLKPGRGSVPHEAKAKAEATPALESGGAAASEYTSEVTVREDSSEPGAVAEAVEAEAKPDPGPENDGTVAGATRYLAYAVAKGFEGLGREVAFHRVAVPELKEVGTETQEKKLGKLVAELLAAELSKREPFVVVERERLDQVMREHRLQGLGLIDQETAAEFGKVLGAQSILTGTVSEAGPSYVVSVRQVEVETGLVLVSGVVKIDRAGLIALSDEVVVTRTRMGAVARSAMLPGWGQVYNRQPIKGYVIMGTALTLAIAVGVEAILGQLAAQTYRDPTITDREELRNARLDANARYTEADYFLLGFGVVWAFGVIDALIFGEDYERLEIQANGPAARWSAISHP